MGKGQKTKQKVHRDPVLGPHPGGWENTAVRCSSDIWRQGNTTTKTDTTSISVEDKCIGSSKFKTQTRSAVSLERSDLLSNCFKHSPLKGVTRWLWHFYTKIGMSQTWRAPFTTQAGSQALKWSHQNSHQLPLQTNWIEVFNFCLMKTQLGAEPNCWMCEKNLHMATSHKIHTMYLRELVGRKLQTAQRSERTTAPSRSPKQCPHVSSKLDICVQPQSFMSPFKGH